MKNYISVNAKYYKHSNAVGEIGHVIRQFNDNKNSIESLVDENFGDFSLDSEYKLMLQKFESIKGKRFQKNANTFVDAVIGFSLDQMEELKKQPDWKNKVSDLMCLFGEDIKREYGLQPVGFNFHCDEAHVDVYGGIKKDESGRDKMNYHAHFIFINYDPLTRQAPLRKMKKSDWSKIQDIAGNRFQPLGFERGISKDITGRRHLEKQELIENSSSAMKKLKDKLLRENIDLTNKNMKLQAKARGLEKENDLLKELNERLKGQVKRWFESGLRYIKRSLKGFSARQEAIETIEDEPVEFDGSLLSDFYENLIKLSKNNEVDDQRLLSNPKCRKCKKRQAKKNGVCSFCISISNVMPTPRPK